MKFGIGRVVLERMGGVGKFEKAVRLPEGTFWASNRTDYDQGDTVLAHYEPQDQFARIVEMDEIEMK